MKRNLINFIFVFLLSGLLAACGSGGGGGGTTPEKVSNNVSGVASKGPINGGTVTVYALNADGSPGDLLGTDTTASDGSFSVNIGEYRGDVLVKVIGGTYRDEATDNEGQPNPGIRAVLRDVSGNVEVAVTPLTEAAVRKAEAAGGLTSANIDQANASVSALLNGADITKTKPVDVRDTASSGGTAEQKNYGLVLAAISKMVATGEAPDIDTAIQNIADDLADNKLDTTAAGLSDALEAVISDSTINKTGVTLNDAVVSDLIKNISEGTIPPTLYTISGTVTSGGGGLSEVIITLSGAATGTVSTDANGNYSFANLQNGSYTVTPGRSGYTFSPADASVTVNGANVIQNFIATVIPTVEPPSVYTISGTVTTGGVGLSDVTITLSGAATGTATTDANGNYSFANLQNGGYSVTPGKSGYTFSPADANVTVNGANGIHNFTATLIPSPPPSVYTISGSVTTSEGVGLSNVTVTLSGAASGTATTEADGKYSFTNLPNGIYTITPSKFGYVISPTIAGVTVNWGNVTQDFTASFSPAWSVTVDGNNISLFNSGRSYTLKRVVDGNNPIVGGWGDGVTGSDIHSLTFYPNGTYISWVPSSIGIAEYGTYSYNAGTQTLTVTVTVAQDSNDIGRVNTLSALVEGNTLTLTDVDGSSTLSRVLDDNNPIVGSWGDGVAGSDPGNVFSLSFYPNSTYIHWQNGDQDCPACIDGEYGIYTYNSNTYELLVTASVDKNEERGLSRPDSSISVAPNYTIENSSSYAIARTNGMNHTTAYADITGDGIMDMVYAGSNFTPEPVPINIFKGDGLGNYIDVTADIIDGEIPGGVHPRKVIFADFNSDGRLDVYIADHGYDQPPFPGYHNTLLLSMPDGKLRYVKDHEDYIGFHHCATAADFDNDRDVDIFTSDLDLLGMLVNDGTGHFTLNSSLVPSMNEVFTCELIDVDKDGYIDLTVGGHEFSGTPTRIFWGSSLGRYSAKYQTILPDDSEYSVVLDFDAEDIDGDGNREIVITRTRGNPFYSGYYFQILKQNGSRSFVDESTQRLTGDRQTWIGSNGNWIDWIRLVDYNQDGYTDILVEDSARDMLWLNDWNGNFNLSSLTYPTIFTISGAVTSGGVGLSDVTITLSGIVSGTATTDADGNYSFANLPNGSYTITPSKPQYTFSPAIAGLIVNGGNVTRDFAATASPVPATYTISGTINYAGEKTGRIYIEAGWNTGISIKGPGTFTIHGVQPGTYTLDAYLDHLGTGARNASNPSGASASVSVTNSDVSGVVISITDPPAPLLTTPTGLSVHPANGSALIFWDVVRDANGNETADSYKIEWSTSPTFDTTEGSVTVIARSDAHYFQSGLTYGSVLYYRISTQAGAMVSAPSSIVGPVTIGAGVGPNTVSGTVTFPGIATGPLYVGLYSDALGAVTFYFTRIASPANGVPYSISGVPNGTYYLFAIVDNNNDGVVNIGDIRNTNGGASLVTINNADLTDQNIILTDANASLDIRTIHRTSGMDDSYELDFDIRAGDKMPVNVTLISGSNIAVPVDFQKDNEYSDYDHRIWLGSVRPGVGEAYTFVMEYSDGSTETLTRTVTGVLDSFATPVDPGGTTCGPDCLSSGGTPTTPTFHWTAPSSEPSSYTYFIEVSGPDPAGNGWMNWYYPDSDMGMPNTQTSVPYNFDGRASLSSLVLGETYYWSVFVQDDNGNQAISQQVNYTPPPPVYTISGAVTSGGVGLSDVTMTLSWTASGMVTTDTNGNYSFDNLQNGIYTVTPSRSGYTFNPISVVVSVNGSNVLQDFTAATTSDSSRWNGMERGTYTWDPATSVFSAAATVDTNSDPAIAHTTISDIVQVQVNGDTMTAVTPKDNHTFTRLADATNPLIGSWYGGNPAEANNLVVVSFFTDGTYMFVQDGDPIDSDGTDGMERGTYTWDPATEAFSSEATVDANGGWGIGYITISDNVRIQLGGDTMTFVMPDGNYILTRVADVTNPIVGSWYSGNTAEANNLVVITFLADGTYVLAEDDGAISCSICGKRERLPADIVFMSKTYTAAHFVDIENDGDMDLVLGEIPSTSDIPTSTDRVLLNDGAGNFSDAPEGTMALRYGNDWGVVYISSGDFNNDGFADLVLSVNNESYTNGILQLLINDGVGHFTDKTSQLISVSSTYGRSDPGAGWSNVSDFDGDGNMDILSGNYLFTNTGNAVFEEDYLPGNPMGDSGDLNNDGKTDYVSLGGWNITSYLNSTTVPGNITFNSGISTSLTKQKDAFPKGSVFIDYDTDGDLDVMAPTINFQTDTGYDSLLVLTNTGGGKFAEPLTPAILPDPLIFERPGLLIAEDFNNDGRTDLFVTVAGMDAPPFPGGQNRILIQNDSGQLVDETQARLPIGLAFTHGVASGDIDNDGDIDLYISIIGGGNVSPYLLLNDGSGFFKQVW